MKGKDRVLSLFIATCPALEECCYTPNKNSWWGELDVNFDFRVKIEDAVSLKCRDSLAAQLEITLTKADSEQLARSIAEEQYSDLEKEKIMKELEIKEMMARHKQELSEKDATIASVSKILGSFFIIIKLRYHKSSLQGLD